MRVLAEAPRGCGHRKDGGAYLTGEPGLFGSLPTVVEIDPPIPVDVGIIPHSRGLYLIDLDMILTEDDQRLWLVDSSAESLRRRDDHGWDIQRYGMPLKTRLQTGICAGMEPNQAETRLSKLFPRLGTTLSRYILDIGYAGKGRRVAREIAIMQKARMDHDYIALLASCWRLAGYSGKGEREVLDNVKRIMVSLGAIEDALALL